MEERDKYSKISNNPTTLYFVYFFKYENRLTVVAFSSEQGSHDVKAHRCDSQGLQFRSTLRSFFFLSLSFVCLPETKLDTG